MERKECGFMSLSTAYRDEIEHGTRKKFPSLTNSPKGLLVVEDP